MKNVVYLLLLLLFIDYLLEKGGGVVCLLVDKCFIRERRVDGIERRGENV